MNLSQYPNCKIAICGEEYTFNDDPETMIKVLLSNLHQDIVIEVIYFLTQVQKDNRYSYMFYGSIEFVFNYLQEEVSYPIIKQLVLLKVYEFDDECRQRLTGLIFHYLDKLMPTLTSLSEENLLKSV